MLGGGKVWKIWQINTTFLKSSKYQMHMTGIRLYTNLPNFVCQIIYKANFTKLYHCQTFPLYSIYFKLYII